MKSLWTFGMLAVCSTLVACGTVTTPDSTGGGGMGGTGQGGGGGAAGGPAGDCPTKLPGAGEPCTKDALICDYTATSCATHARCAPSYDVINYGELAWHHDPPKAGTACTEPGRLCAFTDAVMDSESLYSAALCTAEGWLVENVLCGNGHCGTCPAALPAEGAACDPGAQPQGLTYAHCTYAVEKPCGFVLARLSCSAGAFTVSTAGCE